MQTVIPPSTAVTGAPQNFAYAGVTSRFIALAIDVFLVFVLTLVIFIPLFLLSVFASVLMAPILIFFNLTLIPSFFLMYGIADLLYHATMESSLRGATYGKRLVGVRVVGEAGNKISFMRAVLRYLMKYVSAMPMMMGFIMAFVTARRQALHDLIAETLVIKV